MSSRSGVAHHEAAHAVVQYRAGGQPTAITIAPQPEFGTLGHDRDGLSDSGSAADMEAYVLSCYAGRHAQLRIDPSDQGGCEIDDEIASEVLRWFRWESREQQLRDRAAALVAAHWPEIVAVAEELLRHGSLDESEVETIADIAIGCAALSDLELYRALKNAGQG